MKVLTLFLFSVFLSSAQDLNDIGNLINILKDKNINIPAPAQWTVGGKTYRVSAAPDRTDAWTQALSIINQTKKEMEDTRTALKATAQERDQLRTQNDALTTEVSDERRGAAGLEQQIEGLAAQNKELDNLRRQLDALKAEYNQFKRDINNMIGVGTVDLQRMFRALQ